LRPKSFNHLGDNRVVQLPGRAKQDFECYRDLSLTDRGDFHSVLSRPWKAMLFE
jgi:hypothetical protein